MEIQYDLHTRSSRRIFIRSLARLLDGIGKEKKPVKENWCGKLVDGRRACLRMGKTLRKMQQYIHQEGRRRNVLWCGKKSTKGGGGVQ